MILAIDIGNTNIVMGCFQDDKILFQERVSSNHTATDLEYAVMVKTALEVHSLSPAQISGAILSSVVPSVTNTFLRAIEKYCGVTPLVVGPGIKTGLKIRIDNPAQLGSDLVVDAVAASHEYPCPQIIIDMGTATTFSVVDAQKNYLGGQITTGMSVSMEALVNRTSQLSKISFDVPQNVIGTNTNDCIQSGIMYGNAAMIDGMIERIQEELAEKCTVIATGGLSPLIVPLCKTKIILDDDLMLKGLMLIYQKNRS